MYWGYALLKLSTIFHTAGKRKEADRVTEKAHGRGQQYKPIPTAIHAKPHPIGNAFRLHPGVS